MAPRLDAGNAADLVRASRYRSADEIRRLLADRQPRPDVPASVRRVPAPARPARPAAVAPAPPTSASQTDVPAPAPAGQAPPRARSAPLGCERYHVQFTADRALHAQLQELRALMRHQVPDGDLGAILARAVGLLLKHVRKQKCGETAAPQAAKPETSGAARPSRHIPAAIRRAVWKRDGGRCSYVSANGRRCGAREFLEFDHAEAWARHRSHSAEGITLRCRGHNQQRARRDFGERHMARYGSRGGEPPAPSAADPSVPPRTRQLDSNQVVETAGVPSDGLGGEGPRSAAAGDR